MLLPNHQNVKADALARTITHTATVRIVQRIVLSPAPDGTSSTTPNNMIVNRSHRRI